MARTNKPSWVFPARVSFVSGRAGEGKAPGGLAAANPSGALGFLDKRTRRLLHVGGGSFFLTALRLRNGATVGGGSRGRCFVLLATRGRRLGTACRQGSRARAARAVAAQIAVRPIGNACGAYRSDQNQADQQR